MTKASDLFTKDEIVLIKYICKLFNGKVEAITNQGVMYNES